MVERLWSDKESDETPCRKRRYKSEPEATISIWEPHVVSVHRAPPSSLHNSGRHVLWPFCVRITSGVSVQYLSGMVRGQTVEEQARTLVV